MVCPRRSPQSDPRFRSPIARFSRSILNPNPLSTRTAEPSATLARMTAALLREPTLDVAADAGDDPLGSIAQVAGFAHQGAVRRRVGERGAAATDRDHFPARPPNTRELRRSDLVASPDRRRDRRSRGGAQGESLPAISFPPNARGGDRSGSVAPAQPDPDDDDARDALQEAIAQESTRLGVPIAAAEDERASSRGRSRRTSGIRSCAPASCCSSGCGDASTMASRSTTADELAKAAPGKGLVYLPNHRSHIDYLLLSYLVSAQGLAPPHIAAGANLNFPIVGPMLRRGGAFFLRRSFKGEPLYAAVFREYLHTMLAKGFPIAYFIEGGRSRSGRTLAPKGGLLGMTVAELHARASATAVAGSGVLQLRKAARRTNADRRARGAAEATASRWARFCGSAAISDTSTEACTSTSESRCRSTSSSIARHPTGTRCKATAQRESARRVTLALAREMAQRINAAVVINPINLFAMAIVPQSAPRARRARARAADRLARRPSRRDCPTRRTPCSPPMNRPSVIADALRLGFATRVARSARGRHQGSGRAGVDAQLPSQQRAARLCAARAGREPAGRHARCHARPRRRIRRRWSAIPARGADVAPLHRGGRRGVEAHRRVVRRDRTCANAGGRLGTRRRIATVRSTPGSSSSRGRCGTCFAATT